MQGHKTYWSKRVFLHLFIACWVQTLVESFCRQTIQVEDLGEWRHCEAGGSGKLGEGDGNPENKERGMEGREDESLPTGWNYMKSNFVRSLTIICPIFYKSQPSRWMEIPRIRREVWKGERMKAFPQAGIT